MFHTFFLSLLASPSHEVSVVARLAARDARSNLGSNLGLLAERTGLDPWVATHRDIQTALCKADRVDVPEVDVWRVTYLQRLLTQRLQAHYTFNREEEERLTNLVNSLVIN